MKTATHITITTTQGPIKIELYPKETPKTIDNLVNKIESGFYAGLKFHRVEDWVIQGGDPLGNGTGGGKMPTELSDRPFVAGSVGVARGAQVEVSNDAQFFICTTDCDWLTGQYTNFGRVTEGMDVVKQMRVGDTITAIEVDQAAASSDSQPE